jgi:FlaA1/EpsC-like NDP-sugar epimerase
LDTEVERFVFTSSDMAVIPTIVMGGSKFIGERLVTAANGYRGPHRTLFCCTRFGNVLGSAGSVVPVFQRQIASGGPVTITDPQMTRFFMTLDEAVDLVLAALTTTLGGEIFVPKMHAVRLHDLAEVMIELHGAGKSIPVEQIGLRPGEKFYEELITDHELARCLETSRLLIVLSYLKGWDSTASGARPSPDDYPDKPVWARQLFSSQTATPLDRTAVRQLLRSL